MFTEDSMAYANVLQMTTQLRKSCSLVTFNVNVYRRQAKDRVAGKITQIINTAVTILKTASSMSMGIVRVSSLEQWFYYSRVTLKV